MRVIILVFSLLTMSLFSQTNQDFKVGDQVYYKQYGRCYKAKVTGILENVPGYGRTIQILTESDGSSKKSNQMVDGSLKNTSLNVPPKDLSRIPGCGIISKKGYKIGDVLYYNEFGNCKKVEVVAIPDNTNQINVYISSTNSMLNVLEDKLSRTISECTSQSNTNTSNNTQNQQKNNKSWMKVGSIAYAKILLGKTSDCFAVKIIQILNNNTVKIECIDMKFDYHKMKNQMRVINISEIFQYSICK